MTQCVPQLRVIIMAAGPAARNVQA
jgi:hypothetical protein